MGQTVTDLPDSNSQPPVRRKSSGTIAHGLPAGVPESLPSEPTGIPVELASHSEYEIIRRLGAGGMEVVYLAKNLLMERQEVLKVISPAVAQHPDALGRFRREIVAAANVRHPNIVTAYSAARIGELWVLAMEYIDGLDLAEIVKRKGPLPVAYACHYARQAALGLQHAHEQGMVHRDIKPQNLMLSRRGERVPSAAIGPESSPHTEAFSTFEMPTRDIPEPLVLSGWQKRFAVIATLPDSYLFFLVCFATTLGHEVSVHSYLRRAGKCPKLCGQPRKRRPTPSSRCLERFERPFAHVDPQRRSLPHPMLAGDPFSPFCGHQSCFCASSMMARPNFVRAS